MRISDLLAAVGAVVRALDDLGVPYYVGGSVASSVHGVARTTLDADVIADIRGKHVKRFVTALGADYYASEPMIREAILHRRSFNVIHLATMFKVDVFALKDRDFDRAAFGRIRQERLGDESFGINLFVASPEDVILNKLEWFKKGGQTSDRQWSDALGVVQVQARALDLEYLQEWAAALDVGELLRSLLEQAGLKR